MIEIMSELLFSWATKPKQAVSGLPIPFATQHFGAAKALIEKGLIKRMQNRQQTDRQSGTFESLWQDEQEIWMKDDKKKVCEQKEEKKA